MIIPLSPETEPPISIEEIRGAVAKGYCSENNQKKILDPELCEAISIEIKKLLSNVIQR